MTARTLTACCETSTFIYSNTNCVHTTLPAVESAHDSPAQAWDRPRCRQTKEKKTLLYSELCTLHCWAVLSYGCGILEAFFFSSLFTPRRFYPQRSSFGQAMVTGVIPSPPPGGYVPSFFVAHRVQLSHTARRFSWNVANSCFFALSANKTISMEEKVLTSVHSVRLKPTELILVGMRTTC